MIEPVPGVRPVIPGRAGGYLQQRGCVFDRHAGEIAQLYQFSFDRILRGEFIERVVDR